MIDVVIPVHPKDTKKFLRTLDGVLKCVSPPVRKICVVSSERDFIPTLKGVHIEWVDEKRYPFSVARIQKIFDSLGNDFGNGHYYYQQLLKFYIFDAIPELLDDVLFIDADYTLTRKTDFLTEDGKGIIEYGFPFLWLMNTSDYPSKITHVHAKHAAWFIPGWKPQHPYSGMQHHMLLKRKMMEDLFAIVEDHHGLPFWESFVRGVGTEKWNSASEYVILHHFALWRHGDIYEPRHLSDCNVIYDYTEQGDLLEKMRPLYGSSRYNAVGSHGFHELRKRIPTMDYIPDSLKKEMMNAKSMVFIHSLKDGAFYQEEFDENRLDTWV